MRYLHGMLLKLFVPVFLGAISFFVVLLEVIDLFRNLSSYISEDVPLTVILTIAFYYIPKAINISLPMALLFSISFTMGNLYSNNELISIFASGIPLKRFVYPLIFVGLLLSLCGFYFDEKIVIETYSLKNELQDRSLSRVKSLDNNNVALTSKDRGVIYYAKYYNDRDLSVAEIIIIERNPEDLKFIQRMDSNKGYWKDNRWIFNDALIYKENSKTGFLESEYKNNYSNDKYNITPENFKNPVEDITQMTLEEAKVWIELLESSGKYQRALEDYMEYLKRFSMTLTPLIVSFLSCALGGRFKKNVLLMSLLSSLSISVCYYVFQMVTVELSLRISDFPPLMGAWAPFILFTFIGFVLFKNAKT